MIGFRFLLSFVFCFLHLFSNGQDFVMEDNAKKFSLNFQQISNLVLIPLSINGSQPLNFIIDTGSPHTVITNIEAIQYFKLNKGRPIQISGLGNDDKTLEAYLSMNNQIQIGKAVSTTTELVLLYEENFNLSSRFGVPVYGIIGYDLLKEFLIEINYTRNKISFYEPDYFYKKKKNKLKKFEEIPLQIKKKKPYVKVISNLGDEDVFLNLLVDSGSWDAMWLFEDESQKIHVPAQNIVDYLGFGLNGEIHGKKSRIPYVQLGSVK